MSTERYIERKIIRKPLLDNNQLFFMHIPKTAGLSLIALLDQHFVKDEICPVHEGYRKFLEIDPEKRETFKFIRGHFPYKLASELLSFPRLITFLRDPIKRTLSAISQLRRNEEQGVSYFKDRIGHMDVDQFLDHPTFGVSVPNVSVKYLNDILGRHSQEKKAMSLGLAKERLETFDVIGFIEKFDESLDLLAYTFGFSPILDFPRVNVDPKHSSGSQVNQSVLDRIAELNRDEIDLYEYGMKLFKQRLGQMEMEKQTHHFSTASLPSSIHFDFKRVDPGRGWHTAERTRAHGIVRWSGPQTSSRLTFHVQPKKAYKIRFRVVNYLRQDVVDSLSLTINQTDIPLSRISDTKGGIIFEGDIPKELTPAGVIELILIVSTTQTLITARSLRTRLRNSWQAIRFFGGKSKPIKKFILEEPEHPEVGLLYNWMEILSAS